MIHIEKGDNRFSPRPPHYLNHHSRTGLHTTSTITHTVTSTLPQPSLTPQLHTTSTITHPRGSTLPQPSLTPRVSTLPQPSLTPR
ncbi:MAG: hypothetical protein L0922_05670, partial [Candidatus Mariimomonas ferrooxydans]